MSRVMLWMVVVTMLCGCQEDRDPEPFDRDFAIPRTEVFPESLSAYGLYEEPIAALQPADGTFPYELSSELFTDYALKQRFLRIPEGSSVRLVDGILEYPEGTILVKTFYYPADMRETTGAVRVIETRLLVKTDGVWNVATYLWNAEQTAATLLLEGTTTDVSWIDETGQTRSTNYAVPHEGECVTCHQLGGASAYIGPTLRNLNRTVTRSEEEVDQLEYLQSAGVLDNVDWATSPTIPDYRNTDLPLETRARAYLDMNCAHCHSPDRWDTSSEINVDFRFETPLDQTGLVRKSRDVERQLENGNMPYLGTTLKHEEGVGLVRDYLDGL